MALASISDSLVANCVSPFLGGVKEAAIPSRKLPGCFDINLHKRPLHSQYNNFSEQRRHCLLGTLNLYGGALSVMCLES